MLDEFAQLGPMSIIENAASIVRDYKIRLWIILQNLPQLKALYDKKWESFLSSAGVTQVFTPNDLETAEYFSKRSGIKTKMRKSQSSGTSQSPQGVSSSDSTSYQETDEPVYRKDELWEMPESSQLLLCAGLPRSIMAKRLRYFDEEFNVYKDQYGKDLYGKDPYHMSTEERDAFEQKARAGQWVVKLD
jgi:type IV secretion system protein VirD4